jgi:hypothetical protein
MRVLKSLVGRNTSVENEDASSKGKWSSSLAYRPPAVVTCTAFDNDDFFQSVAKAMLFRFETEGLTERQAILTTLVTTEDKRGFLESLDLRSANLYSNVDEGEIDVNGINEIVERVRSLFGESLRLIWRESVTGYDQQSYGISTSDNEMIVDHHSDGPYRCPLKTPKNLYSPIQSVTEELSNMCSILPKSIGRHRRQFFPDTSEHPRLRPRLQFEINIAGGEPVKCLKLDGQPPELSYTPPSPIAMRA